MRSMMFSMYRDEHYCRLAMFSYLTIVVENLITDVSQDPMLSSALLFPVMLPLPPIYAPLVPSYSAKLTSPNGPTSAVLFPLASLGAADKLHALTTQTSTPLAPAQVAQLQQLLDWLRRRLAAKPMGAS